MPNGDPDAGNAPRFDPRNNTGIISDVSEKRKIRDTYVKLFEEPVFMGCGSSLNAHIAEAFEELGEDGARYAREKTLAGSRKGKKDESGEEDEKTEKGRGDLATRAVQMLCRKWWDVRMFGAVATTGVGAGAIRGAVSVRPLRSLEPISYSDWGITRCCRTDKSENFAKEIKEALRKGEITASDAFRKAIEDRDGKSTMGRKSLVHFGFYRGGADVCPSDARVTGATERDLLRFLECLAAMGNMTKSASRPHVEVLEPILVFRHEGTCSDPKGRCNQRLYGVASLQRIERCFEMRRREGVESPESYRDYEFLFRPELVPAGLAVGFGGRGPEGFRIEWNAIPDFLEDFVKVA
jgi:CRISPR-associated protein Csd2